MTLVELSIAMALVGVMGATMTYFIFTSQQLLTTTQERSFAIQKSIAMLNELRAYADSHSSTGGASALDPFDNGVGTSPVLTTDTTVVNPANTLSGNTWDGTRWRYARRVTVRKFSSYQESNVRVVTVQVFLTQPGSNDGMLMSEMTSVITTQGMATPTTQVYDIYLLSIENIPGWWVYMAYLKPFVENALSDMESRNPGLNFRTHWISKAAYGRDREYQPYFNNNVDSTQDINWVYFYPGSMPNGSAVDQYYIPSGVTARVNVDGAITPTTVNDYNAATNPYPYTLADQYNHAMRWPDENDLYNKRSLNGMNGEERTYRLLLDDMILNPGNYRNAIIMNLHGELLPMPSIRNYSDAAKDPATYPGWRVVTHPENISYTYNAAATIPNPNMNLRVYAYTDTVASASTFMTVPISIVISATGYDLNLTTPGDLTIKAIKGGTDQEAPVGMDPYQVVTLTSGAPIANEMAVTITHDAILSATVITLHHTPLMTPKTPDLCGLDTSRQLYGRDYIPCPVESTNVFTQDLTSTINCWELMASALGTVGAGGSLVYSGTGDYIYAFRGGSNTTFWRYSISGNSWSTRASTSGNVTSGGALVSTKNNFIYAFEGGSSVFRRYSISGDSWTTMKATPAAVAAGASLVYSGTGDYIYALQGGTTAFWCYGIAENYWCVTTMTNTAPGIVGDGAALVFTGGDYFYAFQGGTNAFWRYSISGKAWTNVALIASAPGTVGAGASLVYPGSGDYIYAFRGGAGITTFWRYSISGNSWTVMTPVVINGVSYGIAAGGALVYVSSSNFIYGFQGNSSTTFLRCTAAPKNTARWVITISAAAADREFCKPAAPTPGNQNILTIKTRIGYTLIGSNNNTGQMWPTKITPTNLSTTYIYRNYTDNQIPFSERYQFQGDPRHCPYADVKSLNRYNWYFDNFRCSAANAVGEWGGFSKINTTGGNDIDGWHGGGGTGGDMLEIDVPRFFSFFKNALTNPNCVYTTITGWSYYYMGLGNEIGYDSANGFTNSIPVSSKPFNGASGSRNEQSILSDAPAGVSGIAGVKYIKENVNSFWWGMPWLGELYPDVDNGNNNVYTKQWSVNGNLSTGSGNGKFVRLRRRDVTAGTTKWYNRGTDFSTMDCVRRTNAYGCTSLFNIGTDTATFRHQGNDGTTGTITAAGQQIANNYNFMLPIVANISRPFMLNNNWGGAPNNVPTEFDDSVYSSTRSSSAVISRFYDHSNGANWEGSSLVYILNPSTSTTSTAFVVVNGLDRTVDTGSAFIARYALLSLIHSFLTCGIDSIGGTPSASRIAQLPCLQILTPNVTTELDNPLSISITWSTTWKRWDGQNYTTAYASNYVEPGGDSNLKYAVLYSRDNGTTWLDLPTDTPTTHSYATPGKPNLMTLIPDQNLNANESYLWDVSDATYFLQGSYIIMIEAYRNNQPCHYSYHQQKIYINR
jgi:hypothetical protein